MSRPTSNTGRSTAPVSSSSSISTQSSSSSEESSESVSESASGSFDTGLSPKPGKAAAASGRAQGVAPAALPDNRPAIDRSACPLPVRLAVRSAGLLLGAGGLASMTYAGIQLTDPDHPGGGAARDQYIALMVTGAFEMAIAFVACASAMRREKSDAVPVNPA